MSPLSLIMACFALLGALDLIIGNKFGLGKQFERGIMLLGTLCLSMIGMIVFAPLIAHLLRPAINAITSVLPIEPSVIAGMFLANDMGGASLAMEFASTEASGYFNGLVVGATMGATISFNIPFSMGIVSKEKHESLILGLLCGIIATPVGCLVGGLVAGLPIKELLMSIVPLFVFAILLAIALFFAPNACVKVFKVFGVIIRTIILIGFGVGIFEAMTGIELIPYTAPIEEGFSICTNAIMTISGAFPLVYLLSKLLNKPIKKIGEKAGVNPVSAIGFLSSLATNVTTFETMKDMDEKGAILNSAFAVPASFVFAGHLGFTLAFNASYAPVVIVAKLVAGVCAIFLAGFLYKTRQKKKPLSPTESETLPAEQNA